MLISQIAVRLTKNIAVPRFVTIVEAPVWIPLHNQVLGLAHTIGVDIAMVLANNVRFVAVSRGIVIRAVRIAMYQDKPFSSNEPKPIYRKVFSFFYLLVNKTQCYKVDYYMHLFKLANVLSVDYQYYTL